MTPPQSSDEEEVPSCTPILAALNSYYFYLTLGHCAHLQDVCPYLSPAASPPRTLGAIGIGSPSPREQPLHPSFPSPRKQPHHPSFSAPEGPATLSCHLPPYMSTEHAQSWPSINVSRGDGNAALHEAIKRLPAGFVGLSVEAESDGCTSDR